MVSRKRIAKGGIVYHALNRANGRLRIFKAEIVNGLADWINQTAKQLNLESIRRVVSFISLEKHFVCDKKLE